jgi:hypothetical protein
MTYGCHLAARSLQKRQTLSTLGAISGMQTRLCLGTHQSRTTDDLRPRLEPILLVRGECTFDARNRVAQTSFILFSTFVDFRPVSDASD